MGISVGVLVYEDIIYISENPMTLARILAVLTGALTDE
jgi:hypothetical protein